MRSLTVLYDRAQFAFHTLFLGPGALTQVDEPRDGLSVVVLMTSKGQHYDLLRFRDQSKGDAQAKKRMHIEGLPSLPARPVS